MTKFDRAFRLEQEIKRQDIWFEVIGVEKVEELVIKHAHPLEDDDYVIYCMMMPLEEPDIPERIDELRVLSDEGYLNIISLKYPNTEEDITGFLILEPTRKAIRLPKK